MEKTFNKKLLIIVVLILGLFLVAYFIYKKTTPDAPALPPENTASNQIKQGEEDPQNIVYTENPKFDSVMEEAQKAFGLGQYDQAIYLYNEALVHLKSDKVYSGLYYAYSAKGDWVQAQASLDKAIELNSLNGDYFKWKITLLDEKTSVKYAELKKVYDEAMQVIDPRTRINLTISFAQIAEKNGQIADAVSMWQKAQELFPDKSSEYQKEIDRLNSLSN